MLPVCGIFFSLITFFFSYVTIFFFSLVTDGTISLALSRDLKHSQNSVGVRGDPVGLGLSVGNSQVLLNRDYSKVTSKSKTCCNSITLPL